MSSFSPPTKRRRTKGTPLSKAGVDGSLPIANPHLAALEVDHFYHLGLDSSMDLKAMFGDVKFVCMGGSPSRMESVAKTLVEVLDVHLPVGTGIAPIGKTERFSMFKVGPVISVSHGMGQPSISILLHEITKVLVCAGATDFTYIRVGTSGGLGVEPGTVVVTTQALNGLLQPFHVHHILGKEVRRDTSFDEELCKKVVAASGDVSCQLGKTMGTNCFYEGQARLDGSICEYTEKQKMDFLRQCHKQGVVNIEMECSELASFANKTKVKALVVCCTLLDRLEGDQVTSTPAQLASYSQNAITVACRYIRSELGLDRKPTIRGPLLSQ